LVIASRGTSEEFATGLLNFIAWPMMFLSEVWFSIEGAPHWVKSFAAIFPLTHLLKAVRKIMNDGAGLIDVGPELAVLALMTLCFPGDRGAAFFVEPLERYQGRFRGALSARSTDHKASPARRWESPLQAI
jgi:ABC-2 type transport system permease protein